MKVLKKIGEWMEEVRNLDKKRVLDIGAIFEEKIKRLRSKGKEPIKLTKKRLYANCLRVHFRAYKKGVSARPKGNRYAFFFYSVTL